MNARFNEPATITPEERAALERLIEIAKSDSGQCRRVADFLLAWWNAGSCGGFDLTELWALDGAIQADLARVFTLIARLHSYPDTLGYKKDFEAIMRLWRPELLEADENAA